MFRLHNLSRYLTLSLLEPSLRRRLSMIRHPGVCTMKMRDLDPRKTFCPHDLYGCNEWRVVINRRIHSILSPFMKPLVCHKRFDVLTMFPKTSSLETSHDRVEFAHPEEYKTYTHKKVSMKFFLFRQTMKRSVDTFWKHRYSSDFWYL